MSSTITDPLAAVLDRLEAVKRSGDGYVARCPAHEDRSPSLSVKAAGDRVLLHCHAGCTAQAVVTALRLTMADLFIGDNREQHRQPAAKRPASASALKLHSTLTSAFSAAERGIWQATPDRRRVHCFPVNAIGERPLVLRGDLANGSPKKIAQGHRRAGGIALKKSEAALTPLYAPGHVTTAEGIEVYGTGRLDDLHNAHELLFVEGEGVAEAIAAIGIMATTTIGGAGKAALTDYSALDGVPHVILAPDNDPQGRAHMEAVAAQLRQLPDPPRISIIDPEALGLGPKEDAEDWLDRLGDIPVEEKGERLLEVIRDARSLGLAGRVQAHFRAIGAGEYRLVQTAFPALDAMTQMLLPGTLTLLGGGAGSGKSLMLIQIMRRLFDAGERIALLEFEDGDVYHAKRALAQHAGKAELMNLGWMADHADEALAIAKANEEWLDEFGTVLHAAADWTLDRVATWMHEQAKGGRRVIAVDAVSLAAAGEKRWLDDERFAARAEAIAQEFGVSIILVLHPKKGAKGCGLDDFANGAVYTRRAATALWLEYHADPEPRTVKRVTPFGTVTETVAADRILQISKARNARGAGAKLAFTMCSKSLTFREHGVCIREART